LEKHLRKPLPVPNPDEKYIYADACFCLLRSAINRGFNVLGNFTGDTKARMNYDGILVSDKHITLTKTLDEFIKEFRRMFKQR